MRIAALNTLYFLGLKDLDPLYISKMIDLTSDPHPPVALTASWIVSRFAPKTALQVLKEHVYSTDDKSRRLAAFILGKIGCIGFLLTKEVMKVTPDPYVKANIALGMIGQGGDLTYAADVLYNFLMLRKGKVMWDKSDSPLFEVLSPSRICHIPQVPQYPTMVDHLTRLEIFGRLAILSHPHAEEAIKGFLTHHALGVTYTASTTLLEEGGEDVIDILLNLKGLAIKMHTRNEAVLTLHKKGEGPVKASDITLDHDVEIFNPDHVIAHLTKNGEIKIRLKVTNGRGYQPANVRSTADENQTIGRLHLDASFSPVSRVSYVVDSAQK